MNCNYVKDLLPLYVGRDLDEKRATAIATHIQTCEMCAASAEEYGEARSLLLQYAPPEFSEGVYAGIRQRVLREIEEKQAAPLLSPFLAGLFRSRNRWAVATALLLAVSISIFYFVANRTDERQQVADGRATADRSAESKEPIERPKGDAPRTNPPKPSTADPISPNKPTRPRPRIKATDRATSVAVKTVGPRSTTAKVSPNANDPVDPDSVAARVPAPHEKTLRMEMQTKDPNIRIIWFSTQRTKRDAPNKSSKRNLEVRSNA